MYANAYCSTGARDLYDGQANTRKLIDYGKEKNVKFPAAEYAFYYCQNGIKQGEAFLPARVQVSKVTVNKTKICRLLEKIGGTFNGRLWSSSEYDFYDAWCEQYNDRKTSINYVSCFLAY